MGKLFISHSSTDDAFVRELQQALRDFGQDVWIDSRQLRGGDPLWPEIQRAIDEASAFAVVVSPGSLQSSWVGRELQHALEVQKRRGSEQFPVIPLSLNGTRLGVLEAFFGEEPVYIPASSDAGGVEAALDAILVALRKRLPADVAGAPQPKAEPLEELVLELTDLRFQERDGAPRPSARARLVHEPATPGKPHVHSPQSWRFVAPLGPIEAEELRWYLEKYAIWPSDHFGVRARAVEANLVRWGRLLHDEALPVARTNHVLQSWATIAAGAGRRFSIEVDATLEAGTPDEQVNAARECATLLLGLPWELLHDGDGFLFQGAKPVRVRRRVPGTRALDVPVVATPIRILLVTARPEDQACSYIDHRASALPLVQAMEDLGGLVRIHVLDPPTVTALRRELERARRDSEPYHVVHFDGHGVYDRHAGLGALCFEDPQDVSELEQRRHVAVDSETLGALLREHRIPLVFLEACQTAQADKASGSVASELLKAGVASVVAMSHSVLVETAGRFVEAFYDELAAGRRVGDAMLAGQRALKDDTFRGRIFGAGELRLEDWFVPVLYQEKDDPQLFRTTPAPRTVEDVKDALAARLGGVPTGPKTGFVGRSRELLALQRLLRQQDGNGRYAVIRGQGGEGKTALAAELARWMVRSHQIRRAAFVSVETDSSAAAVLDAIGRQVVSTKYSVPTFGSPEEAVLEVERALAEQSTLVVVDNMESILLPPYLETPEALSEDARRELDAILTLCRRLNAKGDTRVVFTSREALPAPFDAGRNRRELYQLDREDAVKLVERVLNREGAGAAADAARESIEQLVDAVHAHARTLALLAPSLRARGVDATRASLEELMAAMERRFPGEREKSLFASVELSLQRMSPENRERARVLGVFHGSVNLVMLRSMMEWEKADVVSLAGELIGTGLATLDPYNHLTLNPALCPWLRMQMDAGERDSLTGRWAAEMREYAGFLAQEQSRDIEMAATLTRLELANLFALLDHVQRGDAEMTIDVATSLYGLLQALGRPRLVKRVARVRDAAAAALGDTWNHARFEAQRTRIEQHLGEGHLAAALDGAQELLRRARQAGETTYDGADYDLATACLLLARVMQTAGGSEQALPLLDEAQERFEVIARHSADRGAEGMASVCVTERGDCLRDLGRLDEAASAYEEAIRRDEQRGDERDVAVGKIQLGTVRLLQRRYQDALEAYEEARERFTRLEEPASVAVSWHQIGLVHEEAGNGEAAEDAYRKSLAINVRLGNVAGQASTLGQLGNLYDDVLGRPEDAVAFFRQAVDQYASLGDAANEGRARSNLANTLRQLRRFDEARQEILRAIECAQPRGHAGEIWKSWDILADIETETGNPAAAAETKQKATQHFLAYRRDGGENHTGVGRICAAVTELLLAGDGGAAASLLQQITGESDFPARLRPLIPPLQAIVAGSRDRTLAEHPDLHYTMAAELLFLIETLERSSPPRRA